MTRIKALLPVDGICLERAVQFGDYTVYPIFWCGTEPDQEHPIYDLLLERPGWFPAHTKEYSHWKEPDQRDDPSGYAILAFEIEIDEGLIAAAHSRHHSERVMLLQQLVSAGDRALDILRFQMCNYLHWEFIPGIAGELATGSSVAFIRTTNVQAEPLMLHGIVGTVHAANKWVGLDLTDYEADPEAQFLSDSISGRRADAISRSIAGCIRAAGQAYYTVHDEARFLALVFAVDGLCEPDSWRGWQQRTYVAAVASGGDPHRFERCLVGFQHLYRDVRNELVHGGVTFATLGIDARQACHDVHVILGKCVCTAIRERFTVHSEMKAYARSLMIKPPFDLAMRRVISADQAPAPEKRIPNWKTM